MINDLGFEHEYIRYVLPRFREEQAAQVRASRYARELRRKPKAKKRAPHVSTSAPPVADPYRWVA